MLHFFRHYWLALLVATTGVLISLAAFQSIRGELGARHQLEFEWVAQDRNRTLKKGIEEGLDAVRSVRDLFQAREQVDSRAFDKFTKALFRRYRGIEALGWLPLVRAGQREKHEREASLEIPDYRILESSGGVVGEVVKSAEQREWYFPVRYQQAEQNRGFFPGCDQASFPERRVLLERAWATGRMVVSGRIPLLGEVNPQFGFMAFQPVFADIPASAGEAEHHTALQGFVVGVFRIADLADDAMRLLGPRGVEFLLRDESAPAGEQLLDFYDSRLNRNADDFTQPTVNHRWDLLGSPKVTETFSVGDR